MLNVKNYTYSTDRTTIYGLSDTKTVTMDFGTTYTTGLKIIQAPTISSPPTWDALADKFSFTVSGSEPVKIFLAGKGIPGYIKIDDVRHDKDEGKWTYDEFSDVITITHSSKIEIYWSPEPTREGGGGGAAGEPTPTTPTPTSTPTPTLIPTPTPIPLPVTVAIPTDCTTIALIGAGVIAVYWLYQRKEEGEWPQDIWAKQKKRKKKVK